MTAIIAVLFVRVLIQVKNRPIRWPGGELRFCAPIESSQDSRQPTRIEDALACSIKDACRRTDLSRSTLYEHLRSGACPRSRVGRRTFIRVRNLEARVASWP